jgi:hypothetical protein
MKQKSLFSEVKTEKYFPFYIRLLIPIIISHYLIVVPQTKAFWQIMLQVNYYIAMLYSTGIAVLIIQSVHVISIYLDKRIPWDVNWCKRLVYQCLLGLLLILLLNYLAIRLYFWLFNNDFYASGYMQIEFQIVCWMLLSLNIIYVSWYYIRLHHKQMAITKQPEIFIEGSLGNKVFKINSKDILAIIKKGNVGIIYTRNQRSYTSNDAIQLHIQKLDHTLFFQINRSEIYARSVIIGYERLSNFRCRLQLKYLSETKQEAIVARQRLKRFLNWFEEDE